MKLNNSTSHEYFIIQYVESCELRGIELPEKYEWNFYLLREKVRCGEVRTDLKMRDGKVTTTAKNVFK
jgi:hypothetical protein